MSSTMLIEQDIGLELSLVEDSTLSYSTSGNTFYKLLNLLNVVDGIQREIVSCKWGAIELALASSWSACNATDGTYFYSGGPNNTVYINLAGTTNPNTGILLVRFRLYWATIPVSIYGRAYETRLLSQPEDISVRVAVDGLTMQAQPVVAGKFTLANGDGLIDLLLSNYVVVGQRCKKLEFSPDLSGTITERGSGKIGNITRRDDVVEFDLWN